MWRLQPSRNLLSFVVAAGTLYSSTSVLVWRGSMTASTTYRALPLLTIDEAIVRYSLAPKARERLTRQLEGKPHALIGAGQPAYAAADIHHALLREFDLDICCRCGSAMPAGARCGQC